jgi:hypothetical protein
MTIYINQFNKFEMDDGKTFGMAGAYWCLAEINQYVK